MKCPCGGTFQSDNFCDTCGDPVPAAATGPKPATAAPAVASGVLAALVAPPAIEGTGCGESDCDGQYEGGFCNVCGSAPKAAAAPVTPPAAKDTTGGSAAVSPDSRLASQAFGSRSGSSNAARRSTSTSSRSMRGAIGAGLVEVEPIPVADPSKAVMSEEKIREEAEKSFLEAGGARAVPEDQRFCSACKNAVGRSRDNGVTPGRIQGVCSQCRTPFDFTPPGPETFMPPLKPGALVGMQYEVLGPIAHGGMGWIFLAKDRNLSNRWVVLKSVLNSNDEALKQAIETERRFLAQLEHPNVVKVYNFVQHRGTAYIVMEFVGGRTLKGILKDRMKANGGTPNPLPVAEAIAYMLAVLPAFTYLHKLGLAYCDFKPDNLMHRGDMITLIDVGGVRRFDDNDGDIYGTVGFQAPEIEAGVLPSITSDLYTIGRTLAHLVLDFKRNTSAFKYTLPSPDEQPLFAEQASLYRFLLKATAKNPSDRFQTADEMAEQLTGVLREVVARQDGTPRPAASSHFRADRLPQLALGIRTASGADWRALPHLHVNQNDPASAYLDTLAYPAEQNARTLLQALEDRLIISTAEVDLRLAKEFIELGRFDDAQKHLANAEARDAWDWRVSWYRGIAALAQGDPATAKTKFNLVLADLPGELAPKLALALACELSGDLPTAASLYDVVGIVDRSFVSASFGLARVYTAQGDRSAAVAALGRVPQSSSVYTLAQESAVRTLIASQASAMPSADDLAQASAVLKKLSLDARDQARLVCDVFSAALELINGSGGAKQSLSTTVTVLDQPLNELSIRRGLEQSFRELARLTSDSDERIALIDKANAVRPRSWR